MGYLGGVLWTVEKSAQLKDLIEVEGLSGLQCAQRLGISRNSVIGRAYRLGFRFARCKSDNSGIARPRRKAAKKYVTLGWREAAAIKQRTSREERVSAEPVIDIAPLDLTIMQLVDGVCRWPVGQGPSFFYCGHPTVEQQPYCFSHCCVAFQPHRPRPRKRDRSEFPRGISQALHTYAKQEGVKEQTVIREAVSAYLGLV